MTSTQPTQQAQQKFLLTQMHIQAQRNFVLVFQICHWSRILTLFDTNFELISFPWENPSAARPPGTKLFSRFPPVSQYFSFLFFVV